MRTVAVVLLITSMAFAADAQTYVPSTASDYFSQELWIEASSTATWRHLDVGNWGIGAGVARSWGEPDEHRSLFIVSGEANTALADRSDGSDRLRLGAAWRYNISNSNEAAWVNADATGFLNASNERTTFSIGAGAKFRLPRWLPERHPLIIIEGERDFRRYDAAYLRGGLRLDYWLPIPRYGVMIDVGHAFSGYPRGAVEGSADFGSHGTDLTLTLLRQPDPAALHVGPTIEPFVGIIVSDRNPNTVFNFGVRVTRIQ